MNKLITYVFLIVSITLIAGCGNIGDSKLSDRQGNKLSAIEVVKNDIENKNFETVNEEILSLKNSLDYVTGYEKEYYNERIRALIT